MSASSLSDLLASQLPSSLAKHARDLLAIQGALDRALPASLAGHVRVRQLANGLLSLACDSGAVASRLRHQTDALMASLNRNGVVVINVQLSVNPELLPRYVHSVEKAGVPSSALEGLAHLNAEIEDGPLKDALERLLHHHAPKRRE
jgi:hypothetical protein